MPVIDYYFTSSSPYVYLGHEEIRSVAGRHNATLRPLAVDLSAMWAVSGQVPVAQRPKIRQDYRLIDLQRVAERRGLALNVKPKFSPADPALADLVAVALVAEGQSPLDFMDRVFSGYWAREEDMADRLQIEAYLSELGFDAAAIIERAESPESAAARKANADAAVAASLPGVPGYVLNGEPFFGQDRIDDLEHVLDGGRAPFRVG
ncbi:2-hydroxychromene-2-carboxylate isomerase [Aureimonas glaciei]|uniref:2-hydroxychromene-2-carboxylate isomerase n=1 Tax=Aureimonas glaciei TaxID=1776957 RepID=A0A916XTV0_9HYPH|nr:2-hydroxychromene-2-carboxylate isomerase [Aureimonas glaciei]GGD09140.1 2-hydroxychromene-2-carboxylate isomerase [Aureimonas glaciei]